MKTVGVVIPIYNVEKYLKECLDSVINQTYKNLQIVLVNDGSTDENSLNIAKEYTLKDERFILFDKKNGGQSTARNVGIEYFSGEYKLKNKTQTIKENCLIEFNIEGNNPYVINTVYKSYKAFHNEQELTNFIYPTIDYIIFLDSDDYWELNCIEECVVRMDGVEVVWFDSRRYYDNIEIPQKIPNTLFENYRFCFEGSLSKNLWIERSLELNIKSFWFSVMGMIDFAFLKSIELKFLDGIIHEDNLFGVLLFFQLKNVFILPRKMYIHRMRPNSTMNHDKKIVKSNIAQYMLDIHSELDCDAKEIKLYSKAYSWCMIALKLVEFSKKKYICNDQKIFINNLVHNIYSVRLYDECLLKDFKIINTSRKIIYEYLTHNNQILLGAAEHIKNQLCYKLGNQIVKSTSPVSVFLLPYRLLLILISHKIEKKILKIMSRKDPKYKTPSFNSYTDHMVALEVKNHLSYKIGQVLIRDCKNWYKGGILKLPFSMYKTYRDYKKGREHIVGYGYNFDEEYFLAEHVRIFKYRPNFKKPQTFNEKIIHRILYDENPLYTILADKIKSRIFIKMILDSKNYNLEVLFDKIDNLSNIIFQTNDCEYLPKIYGIYKNIDEIDFSVLPNSFVLKTNHDWNGIVVIEDKEAFLQDSERKKKSIEKLKDHLMQNFYYVTREKHYKNIEPRIFAEEYIKDEVELKDFRFHVFNQNIEFIQVANSTHTHNNLYYPNWEIFPITYHNKRDIYEIKKPQQLEDALKIAKVLSLNFDYIRVDMYLVKSKIYIGELTFTPNCGKAKIEPYEWDLKLGEMWRKSDV